MFFTADHCDCAQLSKALFCIYHAKKPPIKLNNITPFIQRKEVFLMQLFNEILVLVHVDICVCDSVTGVDFKIKTVELRGKKIRLQIW